MPLFHIFPILYVTRILSPENNTKKDSYSSSLSTPVLAIQSSSHTTSDTRIQTLCDSTDILHYINRKYATESSSSPSNDHSHSSPSLLYPDDCLEEVLELEQRFNVHLGPHTRIVAYWYLLSDQQSMKYLGTRNCGFIQGTVWYLTFPLIAKLLKKKMRINQKTSAKSLQKIRAEFDYVSRCLMRDNRKYLCGGDNPTAADITFASLAAPVLMIDRGEGYGSDIPSVTEISSCEFKDIISELRNTVAGKFVLEMFQQRKSLNSKN
eukprot:gb/GECH01012248.1/.p1 GENE.gb/GECH01012248.1/~~gb/GECH01012248.1/.p1  ORF type:complete len:265 (+),score=61.65 gb/GECH01012248.1/:1-795(+)